MRLIDADALAEEIWRIRWDLQMMDDTQMADKMMAGLRKAEEKMEAAPTIDPVKHGKWIEDKYMSDVDSCIYTRYICSSCGAIEYKKYSYCHCGAKMGERMIPIKIERRDGLVKVVRCKDCKHRDAENGFCKGRGWPMQLVPDDGFCDKGERRRG